MIHPRIDQRLCRQLHIQIIFGSILVKISWTCCQNSFTQPNTSSFLNNNKGGINMKETCNTPAWQQVACRWACCEAQSANPAKLQLNCSVDANCTIESSKALQTIQIPLNQAAPVDNAEQ